ncbi:MAG: GAF domain-containing sensor histidine kinase [Candidatus Thermoplasmatota archaeon]|nr:GAF domain-containing sensor histidine kinase [Candidatus Thermoplasmatota archaeon]
MAKWSNDVSGRFIRRISASYNEPLHGFIPPVAVTIALLLIGLYGPVEYAIGTSVYADNFGYFLTAVITLVTVMLYFARYRKTMFLQDVFVAAALIQSAIFITGTIFVSIIFNGHQVNSFSFLSPILAAARLLLVLLLLYFGLFNARVADIRKSVIHLVFVASTTVFGILLVTLIISSSAIESITFASVSEVFVFQDIALLITASLVLFFLLLERTVNVHRTRNSMFGLSVFVVFLLIGRIFYTISQFYSPYTLYYAHLFEWTGVIFPLWGIMLDARNDTDISLRFERNIADIGLYRKAYKSGGSKSVWSNFLSACLSTLSDATSGATAYVYESETSNSWKLLSTGGKDGNSCVQHVTLPPVHADILSGGLMMNAATLSHDEMNYNSFKDFGNNFLLSFQRSGDTVLMTGITIPDKQPLFNDYAARLERISALLSVDLSSRRDEEKREKMTLRLLALIDVAQKLNNARDKDELYESVCRTITENIGFSYVSVWEVGEDRMIRLKAWDWPEEFSPLLSRDITLAPGRGIIGTCALTKKPYMSNDVSKDPVFLNLDISRVESELAVPIVISGECTAVLDVESTSLDAFDRFDYDTLVIFSNLMSMSLRNIDLYRGLKESERLAEMRAHMLVHDIKNLFQSITLNLELLSGRTSQSRQITEADIKLFQNLNSVMAKGNKFVNTVLEIVRLGSKRDVVMQNYSLHSLLSSALSAVRSSFYPREINMETDLDPGAAEVSSSDLVEEVFINLFVNSAKYNQNAIVKIKVKSYLINERNKKMVRVEIRDNGIGLSVRDPDIIFERFRKGSKGTGLGLSLVRAIMESSGGRVSVKETSTSGPETGTTFVLDFPLAERALNRFPNEHDTAVQDISAE